MTVKKNRQAAIAALIKTAKETVGTQLTRPNLDLVLRALISLANNREYWSAQEFPVPGNTDLQTRYALHEEHDGAYALYLNVMKRDKKSLPHDHTTWACIAGVDGVETNFLYQRIDGGTSEGFAQLTEIGKLDVGPGVGVALMPYDIHSIRVTENIEVRHLHFYGKAVEMLTDRLEYNLHENSCRKRSVGAKTVRG